MAAKDNQLKILLADEELDKLRRLASVNGSSMGKMLRECVEWRYKMQIEGLPTCSNGHPCFVAHLHLIQRPTATPVEVITPEMRPHLVAPATAAAF